MLETRAGTNGSDITSECAIGQEGAENNTKPTTYTSLFNDFGPRDMSRAMEFQGSNGQVLRFLESTLSRQTPEALAKRVLYSARVIRGVLDFKEDLVRNGENTSTVVGVVQAAANLGLEVYKQSENASQSLRDFTDNVKKVWGEDYVLVPLRQRLDDVTLEATSPELSEKTAGRLAERDMGDVLFIALGHGGVAAGMDVFLRYCDKSGSTDSSFYPVRFSVHKQGDKEPKLTPEELLYLQAAAHGRSVVIFDEDRSSGMTLNRAGTFFTLNLPDNKGVIIEANSDLSTPHESKIDKPEKIHQHLKVITEKNTENFINNYYKKFGSETLTEMSPKSIYYLPITSKPDYNNNII